MLSPGLDTTERAGEAPFGRQTTSRPRRFTAEPPARPPAGRRWWLAVAGLVVLHISHPATWTPGAEPLWYPPVGLGLALTAWLGLRAAVLVGLDAFLVGVLTPPPGSPVLVPATEALLLGGEVALAWWCYAAWAGGSRRIHDPRSATTFVILVPGAAAGLAGGLLALVRLSSGDAAGTLGGVAASVWLSHALGILILAPALLDLVTPWLVRRGLAIPDPAESRPGVESPLRWSRGGAVEAGGLALAAAVLGGVLAALHAHAGEVNWHLWGLLLLIVVWASLRRGLAGGGAAASAAALVALATAGVLGAGAAETTALRGNLLAPCATALLVGASAGWIRASETRYRQLVGHLPVVLYSARLHVHADPAGTASGSLLEAEVILVSPASRAVLGCDPEALIGDYRLWLACVHPDDRELLVAALGQLWLQRQPIRCEYRLGERAVGIEDRKEGSDSPPPSPSSLSTVHDPRSPSRSPRWVRETLAPRHDEDGRIEGWEGVVEDITEQRALASELRRMTSMLQALVAHMPTGVFFVHAPTGQPLFVNARARQLLGRREDLAAGLPHLAKVYRLHRADGTPYPWEELPVSRALRDGMTSMRDDIVVHRPDGRRIPLVTWAAPVDLTGPGKGDGAVWVLEDLTALRQAEAAHQEAEGRLRTIIQTMAEGLLVLDARGAVIEWNPAASAILGVRPEEMPRQVGLGAAGGCVREDGAPLPDEERPDRVALRTGVPVRDVVLGLPVPADRPSANGAVVGRPSTSASRAADLRWLLVSAVPLPPAGGAGRVVVTFVDVTAQRRVAEDLRRVQRLELVGRLAGGVIHDLNNLLTVVMTLAELVRHNLPDGHAAAADLRRISQAGEQAAQLVGQLLAFGRERRLGRPPDRRGRGGAPVARPAARVPARADRAEGGPASGRGRRAGGRVPAPADPDEPVPQRPRRDAPRRTPDRGDGRGTRRPERVRGRLVGAADGGRHG